MQSVLWMIRLMTRSKTVRLFLTFTILHFVFVSRGHIYYNVYISIGNILLQCLCLQGTLSWKHCESACALLFLSRDDIYYNVQISMGNILYIIYLQGTLSWKHCENACGALLRTHTLQPPPWYSDDQIKTIKKKTKKNKIKNCKEPLKRCFTT